LEGGGVAGTGLLRAAGFAGALSKSLDGMEISRKSGDDPESNLHLSTVKTVGCVLCMVKMRVQTARGKEEGRMHMVHVEIENTNHKGDLRIY
jgi:hypothetical protein